MATVNITKECPEKDLFDFVVVGLFESTMSLGKYQTEALEKYPKFKDEVMYNIVKGDLSIANPTIVQETKKTIVYGFPVASSGRALCSISRIHKGLSELKSRFPLQGKQILIHPLHNDKEKPNYWLVHVAVRKILINTNGAVVTHYFPENVGPCPFGKDKEPDLATPQVRVWRREKRSRQDELRNFILGESGSYRDVNRVVKEFENDSPK